MEIPDFLYNSAARVGGRTETMSQKGSFSIQPTANSSIQVSHLNPVLQLQLPHNYLHLIPHRKDRDSQPLGNLLVG
jgi:hypothetical protein